MKPPPIWAGIAASAGILWLLAGAAFAADANSTAQNAPGAAVTRAQIDAVVAQLRGNGLLWQKGLTLDSGPELALKMLFFEEGSVGLLCDVLATIPLDPNGLYVASRLLRQLTYSKSQTILAALETVKGLAKRVAELHKDFPPLGETDLKWLKEPTDQSQVSLTALKKRQDDKIARETPIARVNEAVYSIQGRAFQLMAYSHDTGQYKELADELVRVEKDRSGLFMIIIQAIGAEARKMSPDEGKTIYDILRPVALELKFERKRTYYNYSKPILRPDGVSTYETTEVYPGIALLMMLNRVATACHSADAPAMKVPKDREIEKYWADKQRGKTDKKTPR
jgi:hypothetical protein